jgi:hypothetical protein
MDQEVVWVTIVVRKFEVKVVGSWLPDEERVTVITLDAVDVTVSGSVIRTLDIALALLEVVKLPDESLEE